MLVDYHVHSDFSEDSSHVMPQVIEDAIAKGLNEICFTEHVDYGVREDWPTDLDYVLGSEKRLYNAPYQAYYQLFKQCKTKYQDKITIKFGLEFGLQTHTIPQYEQLFERYPFDFILLSIHEVGDKEFWNHDFQQGKSMSECYQAYYQELLTVVQNFNDYSCLAHFDLIRRYLDKSIDTFQQYKEIITEILQHVIKQGKGIEINTSSFRYQIPGYTPSIEILKLYHQLGGKIITLGSDSHHKAHLGAHLADAYALLKTIGFSHFCTFEKMQPIFHKL